MNDQAILVVDDEKVILDVIVSGLIDDNYKIITAKSGEEALKKLENTSVQLVISDQKMPGITGIEFLKRVKVDYPDILTIILTGYADLDTAKEAINDAGVYKFMTKPINLVELKITVKRALELQQLVNERDLLLNKVKAYEKRLLTLEAKHPGITKVSRDADGYVVLDLDDEGNA